MVLALVMAVALVMALALALALALGLVALHPMFLVSLPSLKSCDEVDCLHI